MKGNLLTKIFYVLGRTLALLVSILICLPLLLLPGATAVPVWVWLPLLLVALVLLALQFRLRPAWLGVGASLAGAFLVLLLGVAASQAFAATPPITGPDGQPLPGSIAALERVPLNDSWQWVSIRGADARKPLLLFLAGGPGGSQLATARFALSALEQHFVVVNWEQPGAGKSFDAVDRATLTPERYVEDAHALVLYLRQRFGQEKVYVLGESWGSALGILLVQRYPELFHAFIGTGQMVAFLETDLRCYDFAMDWARQRGDESKIEKLTRQGPPPYYDKGVALKQVAYLGDTFAYMNQNPAIADNGANTFRDLAAPEYGLYDKLNWFRGLLDTLGVVYPQLWDVDFRTQAARLEVPIYFLIGRHDINAPVALTEEYFELLDAPHKEIVWFERSGHNPWVSESARFAQVMLDTVLAQTQAQAGGAPDLPLYELAWEQQGLLIRLGVDASLVADVQAAVDLAVPVDDSIMFADSHPDVATFRFLEYQDGQSFRLPYPYSEPRLSVYATADFPGYGDDLPIGFVPSLERLRRLLDERPELNMCDGLPAGEPLLPFLPWLNSAQVFCAHPEYVAFNGGQGIRYLTAYAQDFGPLIDANIFYAFQGLSEDGEFYISAVFPIRTGVFPEQPDPDFKVAAWQQVLQAQLARLQAADEAGYSPALVELDALVSGVTLTRP